MKKNNVFLLYCILTLIAASVGTKYLYDNSENNILPILLETKNHQKPLRTPDTFAENFSLEASTGELSYKKNSSFSFKYCKSKSQDHPFTGVWFPLENVEIDFSKFDKIEVEIKTNLARRIPLNLSVQNKKETHQYIRNFIEIKKGETNYTIRLDEFFTPSSWYNRNDLTQVEIPKQDLSKVEALSFESCQLLKPGISDEFTVVKLCLQKDLTTSLIVIVCIVIITISFCYVLIYKPFENKTEVVHVPITAIQYKQSESIQDKILAFLAENYTNPNLTLNDLKTEFGKGSAELSKLIKEQTKLTFPKYMSYLRVEEAKRILATGDFKTISEIGYTVGFNSPSNFIRVFKAQEGISPKKYIEEDK